MENFGEIICENGKKKLIRFIPEDMGCYVESLTIEEIMESFPNAKIKPIDFFTYKFLLMENDDFKVKGPDGVDITDEIKGLAN